MTAKRPSLAGVRYRQRKRNIVVDFDPDKFKESLITIIEENLDADSFFNQVDEKKLDLKRYGDHFFDVLFSGGTGACVGKHDGTAQPIAASFFGIEKENPEDKRARQEKICDLLREFLHRKPFLETRLDQVITMLVNSYLLLEKDFQKATTSLVAQLMAKKIYKAEQITTLLKNDSNVNSGQVLNIFTIITKKMVSEGGIKMKAVVKMFTDAGLLGKLIQFFPPSKRSSEFIEEHFKSNGLLKLYQQSKEKQDKQKITNLQETISRMIKQNFTVDDIVAEIETAQEGEGEAGIGMKDYADDELKQKKSPLSSSSSQSSSYSGVSSEQGTKNSFDLFTVVSTIWDGMMDAVDWSNRGQQMTDQAVAQVEQWGPLLVAFADGKGKEQIQLLNKLQQWCYDDINYQKTFLPLVYALYRTEVLEEDVIVEWYNHQAVSKGKEMFKKQVEPLIRWLELAPEENDEEEDQRRLDLEHQRQLDDDDDDEEDDEYDDEDEEEDIGNKEKE